MAESVMADPPRIPQMDEESQHTEQGDEDQLYENVAPISVSSLKSYIQKQRRDNKPFQREYEVLQNLYL